MSQYQEHVSQLSYSQVPCHSQIDKLASLHFAEIEVIGREGCALIENFSNVPLPVLQKDQNADIVEVVVEVVEILHVYHCFVSSIFLE